MHTDHDLQALGLDHASLAQFTGTMHHHRLSRRHLLTDGACYLSERAQCWWIMDAIASHVDEIGTGDWFILVKVLVQGRAAVMVYEDGNGHEHARQMIPYTDFPLAEIALYVCWDGDHWVIMLPSEY